MKTSDYDITIVPEECVADRPVLLSRRLQTRNPQFLLSPTGPFAHVSLYMVRLQDDKVDEVVERLGKVAAENHVLELKATQYMQAEGYIDIEYQKVSQIDELQMQVVESISPLRAGLRARDERRLSTFPVKLQMSLKQYGYRYVGEAFRPHMTFTRFTSTEPIAVGSLSDPTEFDGLFTAIALFELGDNGTCVREVARIPLA